MKRKYLECDCCSLEHMVVISYFPGEDEIYIETQLRRRPWYKRLLPAIKYIVGFESITGHWEECMLGLGKIAQLHKFLHEYFEHDRS